MKKRWIALLLAALMLLAAMPAALAGEGVYDGLRPEEPEPAAPDGEITVASLLAACKEPTLDKRTELMLALHDLFVCDMTCSAKSQELESAKATLDTCQSDALMGLGDAAVLATAQLNAERAQAESDKAALERLKVVSQIRGLTDVDVSAAQLIAQDALMTLQPSQLTLAELKDAAGASLPPDGDAEQALLGLEQNYIDISLTYAQIGLAAGDYRTASDAREETALRLVMGKATADEFRAATAQMKQARLTLFRAMAEYSKLLYTVNNTCGGALARKAGKLTASLGG